MVSKVYELNRANMEELYNSCEWKWNEKSECMIDTDYDILVATLRSRLSRYLLLFDNDNEIAACLQMQFLIDDDDNNPVLYMYISISVLSQRYSIQVDKKYQNKGLGSRLLRCAEDIAVYCGIPICRLTVFKVTERLKKS